jgi:PPIC-type PPIASE domain
MRMSWLLCVLLGTLALGQAAPSAPAPAQSPAPPTEGASKPATPPDTSASVPEDAVVITVVGVCPAETKPAATKATATKSSTTAKPASVKSSSADCKTTITKSEFERLAKAVAPNPTAPMSPQMKRQLAGVLPRFIAFSDQAKKQGLDKKPEFAETMKFVKMQVLTNELQRNVQKAAGEIPDSEIEKYYKENPQGYEQYSLERIFVPRTKQVDNDVKAEKEDEEKLTDDQRKAKEAAEKAKQDEAEQSMTKLAEDLHAKATSGEDFLKLQKEAYDAAGMKIESPNVNLPNVRRTGLPPAHAAVLDLKAGEVSQVISDSGGHYIYKLISKAELPLDQVKNEIHNKLQNDRMRELMDKLNNSFKSETNEAYFGPAAASVPPAHMPRPPRPGMAPPQTPPPGQPPAAKQD